MSSVERVVWDEGKRRSVVWLEVRRSVIVGMDRFPELVHKVGKSMGEQPKLFGLIMKVRDFTNPGDAMSR